MCWIRVKRRFFIIVHFSSPLRPTYCWKCQRTDIWIRVSSKEDAFVSSCSSLEPLRWPKHTWLQTVNTSYNWNFKQMNQTKRDTIHSIIIYEQVKSFRNCKSNAFLLWLAKGTFHPFSQTSTITTLFYV